MWTFIMQSQMRNLRGHAIGNWKERCGEIVYQWYYREQLLFNRSVKSRPNKVFRVKADMCTITLVVNLISLASEEWLKVKSVAQHIEYVLLVIKVYCKIYESGFYASPYLYPILNVFKYLIAGFLQFIISLFLIVLFSLLSNSVHVKCFWDSFRN